jgi:twinkle protein
MSRGERDWAYDWCKENFLFMDHTRQGPTDIDGILEVASKAVMRLGCRVLVIDPYNHLTLPPHDKETDAISKMMTSVQRWCRAHDAHCFFICHPTKLPPDRRSAKKVIVTGHDIAGSAAWFAKADIGITAWRHSHDREPPECHVWKVRWNFIGRQGSCQLNFDRPTGRWTDHIREVVDESCWDM